MMFVIRPPLVTRIFNECPDNVNISGFYQSEKWFKDIEDDIKNDFTFKMRFFLHVNFY